MKKKDNKVYYRTKGDANNTPDYMDLTIKDVKGIVKFDVPYIAYPSVYLSEFMSKEKKRMKREVKIILIVLVLIGSIRINILHVF